MPPFAEIVLCAHCGVYMPRRREREHRKLLIQPYVTPPYIIPSRLRRVGVDADSEDGQSVSNDEELAGTCDGPAGEDVDATYLAGDSVKNAQVDESIRNILHSRWDNMMHAADDVSDSDSDEELPYPMLEDDEPDPAYIDWAAIEANSGLSAWDRLGEGYERDAAEIGKNQYAFFNNFES
jgi:hypothetical protein